ncbi:hypothetical protein DNK01_09035 [Stutzerimonas kirkiae]|nr:hypothetical protein DNK01_09035 [Stutzerimonas kirkiae]
MDSRNGGQRMLAVACVSAAQGAIMIGATAALQERQSQRPFPWNGECFMESTGGGIAGRSAASRILARGGLPGWRAMTG